MYSGNSEWLVSFFKTGLGPLYGSGSQVFLDVNGIQVVMPNLTK